MFTYAVFACVILYIVWCVKSFEDLDFLEGQTENVITDYEIVNLPVVLPVRESVTANGETVSEMVLNFDAFGRNIGLNLRPNTNLISPNFKTYIQDGQNGEEVLPFEASDICQYLHHDDSIVAAFNLCQPVSMEGIVFADNVTFTLHPVPQELQANQSPFPNTLSYVVRKTSLPDLLDNSLPVAKGRKDEKASHRPVAGLTAEVALFFDTAGYNIFAPYFGYDERKLRDMLLAYMNGVQALYNHPTVGTPLKFVLVRMDIMKKQPLEMPHYEGERSQLLNSFCAYQQSLNPASDSNPDHWDMALYVSGLDFFAYENGHKSGVTMGLAAVGGVCLERYNCVIAELGTTNVFGKPYPSAGFTSVYILAHEIGHNLGMHHDGSGNECSKEGYIMSPSRGVNGETQWSSCSADVMHKLSWAKCLEDLGHPPPSSLDHSQFLDTPGQMYTAKKQCQILLRDIDAIPSPNQDVSAICQNLHCKTPHRSGYYFAGPALEGTKCGPKKICYGGECVSKSISVTVPSIPGNWGPWKKGTCSSGCLEKSKGQTTRRRYCDNPIPVSTDVGCEGSGFEIVICDDTKICRKSSRKSITKYASESCTEFSKFVPELDRDGGGLQATYEEGRLWMSCAIFCRNRETGGFYTPRVELNDLNISPYFPDGTWCHRDNTGDYFCRQHHCLPEKFEFSKLSSSLLSGAYDIPYPQNVSPKRTMPPGLKAYLSLDEHKRPLQTRIHSEKFNFHKDEDWETDDYINLPLDEINRIM